MKIKIIYILILVFILSFSDYFLKYLNLNIPSGYKQALIIIFIISNFDFFLKSLNFDKRFKALFFLLIFISIINFSTEDISSRNFLIGLVFTFLFHLTFLTSFNIKINLFSFKRYLQIIIFVYFLSSLFSLVSFLGTLDYRSQETLFKELGAYGTAMNFALIFSITLILLTRNKVYLFFSIFFTIAIFSTLLKKSIFDCIIIWLIYFLLNIKIKNFFQYLFTFIFFIYLFFLPFKKDLFDNIQNQIDYMENTSTDGVRVIMYVTAFNLSITKFPLGSGLGTFGAPSSIINEYSKTYYETGINLIHELSPDLVMDGKPHTLFDTFWPHILGEFGFIGTLLFIFLWIYPVYLLYKFKKKCKLLKLPYKHFYFLIITMFFVISFDGFTLFIPEIPLFLALFNITSGLALSYLKNLS